MALLEIRNVSRHFGAFEAVKNVSFAAEVLTQAHLSELAKHFPRR